MWWEWLLAHLFELLMILSGGVLFVDRLVERWRQQEREVSDEHPTIMQRVRTCERDIAALSGRMDRAGEKSSELGSIVNGMPERLRDEFLPRETAEMFMRDTREDRKRLWDAIDDCRQGRRTS